MVSSAGRASSRTAEHVAFFRALESCRGGVRLFVDPYAAGFLRPGYRLLARLAGVPLVGSAIPRYLDRRWVSGPRSSAVVRTRLIDDLLGTAVAAEARQVLLLGAGYDSRAYRIPALAKLTVFEIDHPATQEGKRERLRRRLGPESYAHVRFVPVDLEREDAEPALRNAGFATGPTAVIWEGVTEYLTAEAVDATLRWLATATAAGSLVIFTYIDRGALDGTKEFDGAAEWLATVRGVGEPWKFGLDPAGVPAYLASRGLMLVSDQSAREAAVSYLEPFGRHEPAAAFYRVAAAQVVGHRA
ncbi:class I SAM-dependent methyltransferase [Parafrankia discariae]|uniref:class I SAM-dependent methyltransferase n=1 Tax=Parafrankia discariae TaxID=365528 RepID=UPI0007C71036|nr:SAM-dependent methyltransferase [Parafrankia discariae]